jgi:Zinc carboxypeptidase
MENRSGRQVVERDGQLCERKNGRGVDPNRNWAVNWGQKEKDYSAYEEFPGTAPFSEPEASLVRDIAMKFQPHVWIAVHSGE